eukprot:1367277-Pyramimonas_sp.AAC.1
MRSQRRGAVHIGGGGDVALCTLYIGEEKGELGSCTRCAHCTVEQEDEREEEAEDEEGGGRGGSAAAGEG